MRKYLIAFLFVALAHCATTSQTALGASYSITELTIGGPQSTANAINDNGQVTGLAYPPSGPSNGLTGYLYSGGVIHQLPNLGGPFVSGPTEGFAINTQGQVVGRGSAPHAFLYSGGTMKDLGTLPNLTLSSTADGINDSGQIVGFSGSPFSSDVTHNHAFLYSGGVMSDLGTLDHTGGSIARGINNAGQIVGASSVTGGAVHAFLYSGGVMQDLGTLGGSYSYAYGINANGVVVGQAATASNVIAFAYSGGVMHDLGSLPGSPDSLAMGINDSGQIVGSVGSDSEGIGAQAAFLYSGGVMYNLNSFIDPSSGWVLLYANGINHNGQITGTGMHNGQESAFVLTLVPEPSTFALAAFGFVGLLGWRLRRRMCVAAEAAR